MLRNSYMLKHWKNQGKNNGFLVRTKICTRLGIPDSEYEHTIKALYQKELSTGEISELIFKQTGITISPRSLQRTLRSLGVMRDMKSSFAIARGKGRIVFQAEQQEDLDKKHPKQLDRRLRMRIMERDGFKCTLCGHGRDQGVLLQVDHKIARVHGGKDTEENLRVLCIDCNIGKRDLHGEHSKLGGVLKSGIKQPLS